MLTHVTDSKSVLNVQSFGTAALLICSIHVVSLELMCSKTPTSFTLEASICALDLRIIPVLLSFCSSVLFPYRRPLDHCLFPQVCCFTVSSVTFCSCLDRNHLQAIKFPARDYPTESEDITSNVHNHSITARVIWIVLLSHLIHRFFS